jgi:hypothetical protein
MPPALFDARTHGFRLSGAFSQGPELLPIVLPVAPTWRTELPKVRPDVRRGSPDRVPEAPANSLHRRRSEVRSQRSVHRALTTALQSKFSRRGTSPGRAFSWKRAAGRRRFAFRPLFGLARWNRSRQTVFQSLPCNSSVILFLR